MGWQDGDIPGQLGNTAMTTRGFGQEAVQVPVGQEYNLGIINPGQDATTRTGSLSDLAAQNPDSWYLDPQARATPEAQSAFKTAFDKGPADPKSWYDWANHIQKFYGIETVAQLAGQGWFDRFNLSPEEKNQLGQHIAQRQDKGDDPLFGNTGVTIPGALMTLGGFAVGGAGGWAGGAETGAGVGATGAGATSTAPSFTELGLTSAGVSPAAAGVTAGSIAEGGSLAGAGTGAAGFDPGGDFSRGSVDTTGFGSDFDVGAFADPNFAGSGDIFLPNFKGDMGVPGYGYTPPGGMSGTSLQEEIWKRLRSGAGLKGLMGVGSGLYGMAQAARLEKLARQAGPDPLAGDRAGYAKELAALRADPSKLAETPGYKAGLQAVERRMAAQGYLGSGNMKVALFNEGGKMFDAEQARLSKLAGFDFAPPDNRAAVSGAASANAMRSSSLASLGFGAMNLWGG